MFTEGIIIRVVVIFLLAARTLYWRVSERKAEGEKPKTKKRTLFINFQIVSRNFLNLFVLIQLLGLNIFPFRQSLAIELLGLLICMLAVSFSFFGRRELGTNWADAAEFQIKKKHALVTTGIYRFIRHPIYVGVFLFLIGAELVAGSWLVIPIGIFLIIASYIQGQLEEKLLTKHFGKAYSSYMKKTKMFLPNIF